jgi:galactokinase
VWPAGKAHAPLSGGALNAPTEAARAQAALVRRVREKFAQTFGGEARVALGPGRVNLIGEHTDYNDGWVLPMAIERAAVVAFRPRPDGRFRVHATAYGETREVDLETLRPPGGSEWIAYMAGVAWALREAGHHLPGLDAVVDGDVPLGAGLSSSAALELATARAFAEAAGIAWDATAMARLGQRAENRYVGVNCGLMDQMSSAVSREGCALLLDCRTLESSAVPVPAEAAIVVMDTGARRSLAASAYNNRRAACEAAVALLAAEGRAVKALRDVDEATLAAAESRMDPVVFRRAQHVVAENHRPSRMAEAFARSDLAAAGRLMNESHASLRDLYEVSSPELNLVTGLARSHPDCFGARMTGAGFGGCAIALVAVARVDEFTRSVHSAYRAQVDLPSAFFACRPAGGARMVE